MHTLCVFESFAASMHSSWVLPEHLGALMTMGSRVSAVRNRWAAGEYWRSSMLIRVSWLLVFFLFLETDRMLFFADICEAIKRGSFIIDIQQSNTLQVAKGKCECRA